MRVTSPVPVKFLFPSISQHVGRFKTKLCLSYPITKSIWKMSEQVKNTAYPFTRSANSETSGCNLSWEQAWRIIEQVVIVFSRSEAPRVPVPLTSTMPSYSVPRELVFGSDFPLDSEFHIWELPTWLLEVLRGTWMEDSEGTSWKGVRCKLRWMKFSDSACGGFSKDQGYGHMAFILFFFGYLFFFNIFIGI